MFVVFVGDELPLVGCCLLFIVCRFASSVVNCSVMFVVVFVVRKMLIVGCLLFVVGCSWFDVHCLSCVVCCVLCVVLRFALCVVC